MPDAAPLPPLWRCPACWFKTRDTAAVLAHAEWTPCHYLGPHRMYAPPTLTHGGMTFDELRTATGGGQTDPA